MLDLSNSKLGSSYLFSGTKSDKPGYLQPVSSQVNPCGVPGQRVRSVQREVTPGVTVGVNADAQSTFDPIFKALARSRLG